MSSYPVGAPVRMTFPSSIVTEVKRKVELVDRCEVRREDECAYLIYLKIALF